MTSVTSSVVAYTGDRHFYNLAWTDGAVGSLAVNVLNRNIRRAAALGTAFISAFLDSRDD